MDPIITEKQAVIIRHSSGMYVKIQGNPNPNNVWSYIKRTAVPYDFKKLYVAEDRFNRIRDEARKIVDSHKKSLGLADQDYSRYHNYEIKKYSWWLTNDFTIMECKILTIIEPKELP